ncbi:glycosyltransferase [Agromyces sp. ZXT2-6]|uniref:glycosyltransferase n=1 Tax=Agromyces sp. ZXT2-6 TaxID=3461153 RepID=UPI004054BCE4
MSTITVVTVDGGGNVPPTLRIAGELARRGHRIEVLGHRRQAEAVGRAGHAFRALESLDFWNSGVRRSVPAAIGQAARLAADRDLEHEVREAVAGSDAAIVDSLMASSTRGAQQGGVPAAVLFHTYLEYWEHVYRRGPVGVAARLSGAGPLTEWAHAAARIVICDVALDPASSRRTPLARETDWVGALEAGRAAAPDASAPPLVVVSLSTTWFPGQTDAYERIAAALGSLPVRGIITLGGLRPDRELRLPPNVRMVDRADHGELFPRASLVIGHGGHSTTFRALAHGVPVLVLPMHPMLDQPMVGRSIERAGAGQALPKSSSPARLAAAVTDLLSDEGARSAAARLGERLQATDAAGAAADVVERLVRERSHGAAGSPTA